MENSVGPFALVGLIFLGVAVLWARQVAYRNRTAEKQDAVRLILSIAGNLLVLVGILGGALHVMHFLAPIGILLILAVVLMLLARYRSIERRTLLQCIAVAASKGVPIHQAIRSFSRERTDELGYRAAILAEALEAGMNLPEALNYSKTSLPTDALLAMRLGHETGSLGQSVQRISKPDESLENIARWVFEKYLYLGSLLLALLIATTFFMVKLVPVFERMFSEFSVELPALTQMNIRVAQVASEYWYLTVPIDLLLAFVLLAIGLHCTGFLPRHWPGVGFLSLRLDASIVMRALALAVNLQWPMNKTVWLLARIYPTRGVRRRLANAGRHIDNGTNWCDGLFRAGLLTRADWGVLKAAEMAGNVEWALDEMADSSARRLMYRSRLILNIAFPLILLFFGFLVAMFVIGFFVPLVRLIEALT